MSTFLLMILLFAPPDEIDRESRIQQLIKDIARSGRLLQINESREQLADPRKQIAPGVPPLLSFRYFEGLGRHRFGNLDLMLDDAGH